MAKTLLSYSNSLSLFASHRREHGAYRRDHCATMQVSFQACWNRLVVSNRLQVERVRGRGERGPGVSSSLCEGCRVFISSPPVFKTAGSRLGNSHRRHSKPEHGSASDSQPTPVTVIDTEAKVSSSREVEIMEDDKELEKKDYKSQFERLAQAMAVNDDETAEQVLQELGNPFKVREMRVLMDDANGLEDNLQELYSQVNKIIEEGDFETAREIVEANYEALLSSLGEATAGVEQAAMLDILAQLRLSLGDTNEAEHLLEQMERILENVGPETHVALLDNILTHMGNMYKALGQPAKAVPLLESSLQIQENATGEDSPLIIRLLLGLAGTYLENDEEDKAIETYQRVVTTLERISGPNDEQLAIPLAEMGHLLLEVGRFDEAEMATLRSLRIVEEALGPERWQVGCATCSVARVKTAKGDFHEAEYLYRKGLQIVENSTDFPEGEGETLMTKETIRSDFAELLDDLERYDEAQKLWRKNLQEKEKELGENDAGLAPSLQALASSLSEAEKYDEAEHLLRRSLKLLTSRFGPNALETSHSMESLASVLHHLDKDDKAELLARQALRIRESTYGPFHTSTAAACNTLASILNALDQSEEALALMQRVLRVQETEFGPDSLETGISLELIIMLLEKLDRQSEILPFLLRLEKLMGSEAGSLVPQ